MSVEERIRGARETWPGIEVDDGTVAEWIRQRLGDGALDDLRVDDIFLACGCAAGDLRALVHFRDRFRPAIAHAVSKVLPQSQMDDAVQRVFVKLLVGTHERPPAITSYGGRGKLSTWLQVVARREASNARRSLPPSEPRDDVDALYQVSVATMMEGETPALKQEYRAAFRGSFHHALAGLSARERNLLRYECIDGLTIDEIAKIYRVSRSTVGRWRAACREKLFAATKQAFNQQLGIVEDEFGSVVRLIESQLNVSLKRVLNQSETDDDAPGAQ